MHYLLQKILGGALQRTLLRMRRLGHFGILTESGHCQSIYYQCALSLYSSIATVTSHSAGT